jgi:hypothetical protein
MPVGLTSPFGSTPYFARKEFSSCSECVIFQWSRSVGSSDLLAPRYYYCPTHATHPPKQQQQLRQQDRSCSFSSCCGCCSVTYIQRTLFQYIASDDSVRRCVNETISPARDANQQLGIFQRLDQQRKLVRIENLYLKV